VFVLGSTSRRVLPNVKRRGIFGSHLHLLLVAFIALACVSCSFFPKKELNGTAEERPKLAQDVLTTLGSVNATLEVLYSSVARGLNENGQTALDLFVVEAAAKKAEPQQQADLIKTGLEIFVDLKSAKLDAAVLTAAINSMRSAILVFDTPALRYIQELGRSNLTSTLNLAPELLATNNVMARTLFTLAAIVERAGLVPGNGTFQKIRTETIEKAKLIEDKIIKLQPALFANFQPHLATAFNTSQSFDPARNANFEQTDFTFNSVLNGLTLAAALQTQKGLGQEITKEVINSSLKDWAAVISQASIAVANGGEPPPSITIPEKPPALDSATGALPEGYPDWKFYVVEVPLTGTLDLTKNPPVYTPASNFGNSDSYRFRACQQVVKSYCTEEKLVTVNRPMPPWTVTLKTATGNSSLFTRGVELICEAALRSNDQIAIYTWWLQRWGQTQLTDITARSTQPGRLVLNDISINDRVSCKAYGESSMGLRSTSPKDSNILVAMNSAPQDITLSLPSGKIVFPLEETVTSASYVPPDSNANKREIGRIAVTDIDPADPLANVTVSDCDGVVPCPFQIGDLVSDPSQKKAVLYLISPLNFEQKSSYNLTLKAVDGGRPDINFPGGAELTKKFNLDVINQNDPLSGILPAQVTLPENSSLTMTELTAVDEDCAANAACQNTDYTFSFEPVVEQGLQQDSAFFEIVGRTLRYKDPDVSGTLPNFEKRNPEYVLKIKATHSNASTGDPADVKSLVQQIKVNITDVNEAPTDVVLSLNEISENQMIATPIGDFNVADVDSGEAGNPAAFDYTLTELGPTSGSFEIVGQSLITKKIFDYELLMNLLPEDAGNANKRYFQIMVTAKDKRTQGFSTTKTFKIYLNDVNETPTNISVSKTVLQEGVAPSDPLVQIDLATTDPDTTLQNFGYQIVEVKGNGQSEPLEPNPFTISGSTLMLTRPLAYNSNSLVPNDRFFNIKISSNDGQFTIVREFLIQVSRLSISNSSFDENDPAADAASDPNDPNKPSRKIIGSLCVDLGNSQFCDEWTYSLKIPVDGLKIMGRELYRTRVFNFETEPTVSVAVVASHNGSTMERVFILSVQDKNDIPTGITFSSVNPPVGGKYYILEEDLANSSVGTFQVADEDSNAFIDWDLSNSYPDGDAFFTITPRVDSKLADLKIGGANLPKKSTTRIGFSIRATANDSLGISSQIVDFVLISYATLEAVSLQSNGFYSQAVNSERLIDFNIKDETNVAVCSLSTGVNVPGIFFSGVDSNLIDSVSSTEVSAANGTKTCRLSITPKPNVSGEDTLTIGVRWSTALGVRTSTSTLDLDVAFWRAPELYCPSRISLPVGSTLANVPCDISFSDLSAPLSGSAPVLSTVCSGLSISNGLLQLSAMPAAPCTAQISAGIANKYGQSFDLSRALVLNPMKFTTNGTVKAIARDPSGNIYLGGSFTAVDPIPAPGIAAASLEVDNGNYHGDRATGCNLTEGFNGTVRTIVDAGDGSFWVGGDFTHYRNIQVNYLTRLTCAGERVTWYPTGSALNAPVNTIAVAADKSVFVGGRFSTYNGVAAQGIVKLDPVGVRDTSFVSKLPSGAVINSIALTPSSGTQSVWMGGSFSSYDSESLFKNLVRVDQSGTKHSGYTSGDGFDSEVNSLSTVNGGVLVGGRFLKYGSTSALRFAKLSDSGVLDVNFHNSNDAQGKPAGFNGRVDALANDGTHAYVGGTFSSWRGALVGNFAKIALADGAFAAGGFTQPSFNAGVKSLLLVNSGAQILAGGLFTSVGGESHFRLALITNSSGAVVSEFNNDLGFNGSVLALASTNSGTVALLGGEFSAFEGSAASRLARFDSDGVFSTAFNSGMGTGGVNGDVETLAYDSASLAIYAGGNFTQVGTTATNRIAKLHVTANNGANPPYGLGQMFADFDSGTGFNGTVRAIAKASGESDSDIYVGGEFTSYNGNPHARLLRLNYDASVDSSFALGNGFALSNGGSASVNALLTTGSSIFVGGEFDSFRDEPVSRVVKLDTAGELDTSFDVVSGPNQAVNALALRSNDLFVGGQFTSYAGNSGAQRVARVNAETGALATNVLYSVNGTVRALGVDADGRVYLGGSFTSVDGTTTGPLARINSNNSFDSGFNVIGSAHLNANPAAGIYTLLPFATGDTPPINMLFSGGLISAFRYLSSPSANLWQSP
jgi:hypothetical protein